ncbi:MAG: glycosyltransferase [Methylophagaceae bacterium]
MSQAKQAVLVLGMHRSGTSALTHVLELLGVELGSSLLPASRDNETGYFEDIGLVLSNDKILSRFGAEWDSLTPIDSAAMALLAEGELNQLAAQIIEQYAAYDLWGWKDPRLCRTLPFWLPLIDKSNTQTIAVIAVRHPVDVAESLKRRNDFSFNHTLAMWLLHSLEAELHSRALNRTIISYETLMAEPVAVAKSLLNFLSKTIEDEATVLAEIKDYISPDLQHHNIDQKSDYASETRSDILYAWAMEVYQILTEAQLNDKDQQRLDEIRQQFYRVQVTFFTKGALTEGDSLESIISIQQKMGGNFAELAQRLVETNSSLFISKQSKLDFYTQVIEHIIKQAIDNVNYAEGMSFPSQVREDLKQFLAILDNEKGEADNDLMIKAVKQNVTKLLQTDNYRTWIRLHEMREVDAEVLAERMMTQWQTQPVFHCFMFVLPGEEIFLANTIDSLSGQMYSQWQLTVIAVTEMPDPIFEQVPTLHWHTLQAGEQPYDILNQHIKKHESDWIALIEPGTQFSVQAFAQIADYINLFPIWSCIYTDDDIINGQLELSTPRFKPDFNLDLLRSSPYIGNVWVSAQQLLSLGGIQALAGAENYDIALRWFDRYGEQAMGHIAEVLIHQSNEVDRPFDSESGKIALQQHLERNQLSAQIHVGYVDNSYRVEYVHSEQEKVSIVIATKDNLDFLQACIESIIARTDYPNYDIVIVDNQSVESETLSYYRQLQSQYPSLVTIIQYDGSFNKPAMYNEAVAATDSDYILLISSDTEIVQDAWLARMMAYGQRQDVAIVGARLVYPEHSKISHAGIILGLGEVAEKPYNNQIDLDDDSYMERARLDQNYSAVSSAALLIKTEVYRSVQGMDDIELANIFNDVDLCLKVTEQGHKILWTPHAVIVHHASNRASFFSNDDATDYDALSDIQHSIKNEKRVMWQRWLPKLGHDPAYNKNLSLTDTDFSIDLKAPQNWDVNVHSRLRCYGVPVKGGSGYYRMKQAFDILSQQGLAQCETGKGQLTVTEMQRLQPDTYIFQNAFSSHAIELMHLYKTYHPQTQLIFTIDDLIHDVPEKSSVYKNIQSHFRDAKSLLRKALKYCDRVIVSTQPLADLCQGMTDDVELIPNRLDGDIWLPLQSLRNQGEKPRVGWAGAQQHQGDLELIHEVVKETAQEVDWIFMGMCPTEIQPYVKESYPFVSIKEYPEKLASLNLDLAIAPLEVNEFNRAKSNLRIVEYGVLGWPVVCTDVLPYQSYDAPVTRVANEKQQWLNAIRAAISDPQALQAAGDNLRQWVLERFILQDHLQQWLDALSKKR